MSIPKEQILDGALKAWNTHGLRRTSLKLIAEAAGVGEVTLSRHFGNKATLLQAALDWEMARFLNRLSDTGEPRVDLLNLIKAVQSLFTRRGRLMLDLALENPFILQPEGLTEIVTKAVFSATSVMQKYQARGILRQGNPQDALLCLIGPLIIPTIRGEPWEQLSGGPEARLDAFLRCWADNPA
jgi:TetR/AcrR family transcriptional regulator